VSIVRMRFQIGVDSGIAWTVTMTGMAVPPNTASTTATIRIAGVYLIFVGFSSDQLDRLVDVAAWLGMGARLVRSVHEGLSDVPLQARQADVEAGEGESAVSQAKAHFSVDGRGGV